MVITVFTLNNQNVLNKTLNYRPTYNSDKNYADKNISLLVCDMSTLTYDTL